MADIIVAVDEPIDATGCAGKENCMGDDAGRCMTHDLWASLNVEDDRVPRLGLAEEAGRRAARQGRLDRGSARCKRAISTQPVVKPIKINAPNSVFALGNAFSK